MSNTDVRITFEGLMVFRRDASADVYDIGILEAKGFAAIGLPHIPDHRLEIRITPNPATGSGTRTLDEGELGAFLSHGTNWNLDVVNANNNIRQNIKAKGPATINRFDTDGTHLDFAWVISIEELHGSINPDAGHLKPVIRATNGWLSTVFKTDGIDIFRGPAPPPAPSYFGFVAETVALDIDGGLSPGEALVLKVGSDEIFRVDYHPARSYKIEIENTAKMSMPMPNAPDHFQAYYGRLFSRQIPEGQRYKLQLHEPKQDSPNPPPPSHNPQQPRMHTIDPYKCGGLILGDGNGPLG